MKAIFLILMVLFIIFSAPASAQESIILTKGKRTRVITKGDLMEVQYGTGLSITGILQFTPEGQPILAFGGTEIAPYPVNLEYTQAIYLPRKNPVARALLWSTINLAVGIGVSEFYGSALFGGRQLNYMSGFIVGTGVGSSTARSILNDKRSFRKSKGWRFEVK
jgi:hypothetical protein